MRPRTSALRIACTLAVLGPGVSFAQAPTTQQTSPLLTPITLDDPRHLPAPDHSLAVVPAYPQYAAPAAAPPVRRAPPLDVRLVTAEQPLETPRAIAPRRLVPRSEGAQKSLARPAAISPGKTLGTVAGSLALVLGLFAIIAWCAKRAAPQATSLLPKEAVEVLGRTVLAARQQVQLVRVGNKLLLVAITPTEAKTLTEITTPTEVEHLLGLCRRGQTHSASVAFLQTLSELSEEPAAPGFLGSQRPKSRGAT